MKGSDILAAVDHTLLKPTATWAEIQELCGEAIVYKTASVCIPPVISAGFRRPTAARLRSVLSSDSRWDTTRQR